MSALAIFCSTSRRLKCSGKKAKSGGAMLNIARPRPWSQGCRRELEPLENWLDGSWIGTEKDPRNPEYQGQGEKKAEKR
jgi:hypothetical protein